MKRSYYSSRIATFLADDENAILGQLTKSSGFAVEQPQRDAWLTQIQAL